MKPFKSALWAAKFTASLILLLVLIPTVGELSFGVLLYALPTANKRTHDRWLHENRAALPTCEQYQKRPALPAGFALIIPVNERGDWLCKPNDYK